ncbi:MAG: DUF4384 domain-containing protein [Cyanobacteria bacterium SZAS LIN-3]|nr:DUF4384 domain-containing protein [Cyanobacteria bacterium SZAS LIN-3]
MKSRINAILLLALALTLPCGAATGDAPGRCAKDMYFDQLDSPAEAVNTGVKYWIQLRRKGQVKLVDNRTSFLSGDEIRFQLIPNIDGYAYVVLAKGTTGGEKVLFPNTYEPQGKVKAGRQYLLPARGFLQFDKHAGIENVRLVVSRKPLTRTALLDSGAEPVKIASNTPADKPVQSKSCILTFGVAESKELVLPEAGQSPTLDEQAKAETSGFAKDLNYVPPAAAPRGRTSGRRVHRKFTGKGGRTAMPPVERPGAVTVINTDPDQSLAAEIQLTHL